jgi:hypothetical protein
MVKIDPVTDGALGAESKIVGAGWSKADGRKDLEKARVERAVNEKAKEKKKTKRMRPRRQRGRGQESCIRS